MRSGLIILALLFLVNVVGSIIYYKKEPLYVSHAMISVGFIRLDAKLEWIEIQQQPLWIERQQPLIARLKAKKSNMDGDKASIRSAKWSGPVKGGADGGGIEELISVSAAGSSPQVARDFLKKVVDGVIERHDRIYGRFIENVESERENLAQRIELVRQQEKVLEDLSQATEESSSGVTALLVLKKSELAEKYARLTDEKRRLESHLIPPYSKRSKVLQEPELPTSSNKPSLPVYLAFISSIAVAIGYLLIWLLGARSGTSGGQGVSGR